jgi:predicted hotdog family 3-hydroxylacyl-ACP dehydratase
MKPPPPIEELLPHRYGMLLVDRLLEWDASSATVSARPAADAWYAETDGMPSRIGIELMAQAIAAHVSVVAWSKGEPPKKGVLLGARSYRATQPYFAVGRSITIKAVRAFSDESGMGAYDCSIENAAKARILVFEPPDFEAFIAAQKQ